MVSLHTEQYFRNSVKKQLKLNKGRSLAEPFSPTYNFRTTPGLAGVTSTFAPSSKPHVSTRTETYGDLTVTCR